MTATEKVDTMPGGTRHRDIEQSSLLGVRERFTLRHSQLQQRIIADLRWGKRSSQYAVPAQSRNPPRALSMSEPS